MKRQLLIRNTLITGMTTAVLILLSYGNGVILEVTDRRFNSYIIPFIVGIFLGGLSAAYLRNMDRNNRREKEYLLDIAKVLAEALGEKDPYTKGHSLRVTEMSMNLARRLGLPQKHMDTLRLSAILHDIGKIGVPDTVLRKTGKLSDTEWQSVRQHPENSEKILEGLTHERSTAVRDIVRHHHERWDGGGYPDGLKETAIILGARIIALADSFDAMTSDRPYRKGQGQKTALNEIRKFAGSQFDPALAHEFVAMIEEGGTTTK